MTEVLGISLIELDKTLIDTANSMLEHGVLKKSKKSLKSKEEPAPPAEGLYF